MIEGMYYKEKDGINCLVVVEVSNAEKCPCCYTGYVALIRHDSVHSDISPEYNMGCTKCGNFYKRPDTKLEAIRVITDYSDFKNKN